MGIVVLSFAQIWLDFPDDVWDFGKLVLWAYFLGQVWNMVRVFIGGTMQRTFRGWPSTVMLLKFKALAIEAEALEKEMSNAGAMHDVLTDLRQAIRSVALSEDGGHVHISSGAIRGLFQQRSEQRGLMFIFGEPPSWRWVLPLVPGGEGDPLMPESFNSDACKAWVSLGAALKKGSEAKKLGFSGGHGHGKCGCHGHKVATAPVSLSMPAI